MEIVTLLQGTPEWHAHRAKHRNASDTPAVTGHSPYKSRSQFLKERATGITPEVDSATQRRFDDGHRYEALARTVAENIIGESLFPVTGTEGLYSASFDGLTMMEDVAFEHKTLNDAIRACETAADLPIYYREQMEHQLMVSGAGKCLFMASLWDRDDQMLEEKHFWYDPDLALRKQITAAWDQFDSDLANYQPADPAPAVVAEPVKDLPALYVHAKGEVTDTNLPVFKQAVTVFLAGINKAPKTDQEFADAKAIAAKLRDAAKKLQERKEDMLAQTATIGEVARVIDQLAALMNKDALALEKAVTAEEEARKLAMVQGAKTALAEHIAKLNERLGQTLMPMLPADFAGAIKGKRNIESMQNAIDTELARAKISASEIADRIEANRKTVEDMTLFPDFAAVCTKAPEDFAALLALRISQRQEAEARRKASEAERAAQQQAAQVIESAKAPASITHVGTGSLAQTPTPAPAPIVATVEPIAPQVQADTGALMKLGEINAALGIVSVTADQLATLGFLPAKTDKNAKLYSEAAFPGICAALVRHIQAVAVGQMKQAA